MIVPVQCYSKSKFVDVILWQKMKVDTDEGVVLEGRGRYNTVAYLITVEIKVQTTYR